ncbi:MAG: hypothetical protein CFE29_17910 [Bradyrhizobiaceae bacterium PARB1]|nr:MAG: hypothetical protein CFE29_17910 [Bradyrhizobiaceae bacterium PARB1]
MIDVDATVTNKIGQATMNLADENARIERAQQDVRKYVAVTREASEQNNAVTATFAISGMIAGAALFGAGMAFVGLMG